MRDGLIAATIAVLCSHACSTLTENSGLFDMTNAQNMFMSITLNLLKWGVPIFFMISGYLMLSTKKEITPAICISKYAKRILLALIIFGIPFAMIILFFEERAITMSMVPRSLLMVLTGEGFSHLWYLYALIGIYLFLPFLKTFTDNCSRSLLCFTLGVLFVLDFCIPFIDNLTGIKIAFTSQIGIYIFYLLLGKLLSDIGIDKLPQKTNTMGCINRNDTCCCINRGSWRANWNNDELFKPS